MGQQAPLQLISQSRLDSRLRELVFSTPYLSAPTYVRVLLPAKYYSETTRRYPSLYLLDGCCNSAPQARDWTTPSSMGDAEQLTANDNMIVVMPDAGMGGMYTDWYNNGLGGVPRWESYIIGQLRPWIDAHLRTIDDRAQRAIAGVSMGGFGALKLAARHPDLFISASSFSGIVDSEYGAGVAGAEFDEALAAMDGGAPGSVFGPHATEDVRWRANNPVDLAGNLRGLTLELRVGNGDPGPYDQSPTQLAESHGEALMHEENVILHQRLSALGLAHTWDDYGPGSHSWPYWNRDLARTLAALRTTFAHPPALPATISFTTAEPDFTVYGYHVELQRDVLEFATLDGVTVRGFSLVGSGTATVTTAARYRAGHRYHVTNGTSGQTLTANGQGRLVIRVDLGPSNITQQFRLGATTQSRRVSVAIAPAAS